MFLRHGRYYRVAQIDGKQKWIALSRDCDESLLLFEASVHGRAIPKPNRTQKRIVEGEYREAVRAWFPRLLENARRGAQARRLTMTIDRDALARIAEASGFRCAVTGMRFSDMALDGTRQRPYVPSIDRINCGAGYDEGNCRLVLAAVNVAMNQWGEAVLAAIAEGYVRGRRRKILDTSGIPCIDTPTACPSKFVSP